MDANALLIQAHQPVPHCEAHDQLQLGPGGQNADDARPVAALKVERPELHEVA